MIDRPEVRVGGFDELVRVVVVADRGDALSLLGDDAADDAADGFAVEVVALQIRGQAMRADDVAAGGAGGAPQRSVGHPGGAESPLHVGNAHRRAPGDAELGIHHRLTAAAATAAAAAEVAVDDRELPVGRNAARAPLEPQFAVVVLRHAPLRAVAAGGLFDHGAAGNLPGAEGVDGAVQPVVQAVGQEGLFVLDVGEPPPAGVEELLLVGHPIAVRVRVLPDVL